jgi:nitrogen PTS system EIIA component
MEFKKLLIREAVRIDVNASSRKAVLHDISSALAAELDLDGRAVFEAVIAREKLGPTGVGGGVAIPHARLAGLDQLAGTLWRLAEPIDFEAADGRPADLIFLLLTPEEGGVDHLKALARVARELRQEAVRMRLRGASTADAMVSVLEGQIQAA